MKPVKIIIAASVVAVGFAAYTLTATKSVVNEPLVAYAADEVQGPKQILGTEEMMKLLTDPTYEDLKDAIEVAPEKRKDWRTLYIAAFNLAEINNLNYSRQDEDYMKTPEWMDFVTKARDEVVDLAEAVRDRPDYAVLKEKFMVVMQSCNECHAKFAADEEIDEIEPPLSWNSQ